MRSCALLVGGLLVAGPVHAAPPVRYDGHQLVRVHAADETELREVLALADDVFGENIGMGRLDLRVSGQGLAALQATGLPYTVLVADLQAGIDAEARRLQAAGPSPGGTAFYSDFRDLEALDAELDTIAEITPDVVEVVSLGVSVEERPIRGLVIGFPVAGKPSVLIMGTQHAREWLSTMVTACIGSRLAADYGHDSTITELVEGLSFYVVPVVNPDGYAFSWTDDRYWRKNRRDGHGVDINRNWSLGWGGEGASSDPEAQNYRGTEPFSEPETRALGDFVAAHPDLVALVDLHSYGDLVLYPWGWTLDPAPDDDTLASVAIELSEAMAQPHGHAYLPIQASDLYFAAGAVEDWSYGEFGLNAFAIELRGSDFVVPASTIEPTCDDAYAGLVQLAGRILAGTDPGETSGTSSGESSSGDVDTGMASTGGSFTTGTTTTADETSFGPPLQGSSNATAGETGAEGCACRTTAPHGSPRTAALCLLVLACTFRRRASLSP